MQQILIGYTKHGHIYVAIGENQEEAFLKLFREFDAYEYYQFDTNYYEQEMEALKIEIADLKEAVSPALIDQRKQLETKFGRMRKRVSQINAEAKLYQAAKGGDARAAHQLLRMRVDNQYEGWDIKNVL